MPKAKQKEDARDLALRRIEIHARTENEIRRILKEKEYSEEEIEDCVAFLLEYSYLNDIDYARSYYVLAKEKCKSDYRIVSELIKKGVSKDDALAGVEEAKADEDLETMTDEEAAFVIAGKMREQMEELGEKEKAKIARRLAYLGYGSPLVYKIIGRLK